MTAAPSLTIAQRFCGPTGTANGGYACGSLAAFAPQDAVIRLTKPVPLDTELIVEYDDGWPYLRHGDAVIAQSRTAVGYGQLTPPDPPSRAQADAAARHYAGFEKHPAPICFVCGPRRTPDDGLRIYAGAIAPGVVASPWTPDPSLDAGDGAVRAEFMWAALDCPGFAAVAADMRQMLLGELAADITRRARIGEPCTVLGWQIAGSGRKHEAGTALFGADGERLATARAIWIEPRTASPA